MKSGPSLVASAMLIALFTSSGAASAQAQTGPPPDLRMLLNLDLFKPNPNAAAQNGPGGGGGGGGDGSMLEQIQTLGALGYLGNRGLAPANSGAPGAAPPNNPGQAPIPSSPANEPEIVQ
ncbi:MAG TPA: hypothetical protein VMV27_13170 [Candidatus Binataceae bacterium]|nr:hypothetical protein [Candidatus Binataceae bacterium]